MHDQTNWMPPKVIIYLFKESLIEADKTDFFFRFFFLLFTSLLFRSAFFTDHLLLMPIILFAVITSKLIFYIKVRAIAEFMDNNMALPTADHHWNWYKSLNYVLLGRDCLPQSTLHTIIPTSDQNSIKNKDSNAINF